MSKILKKCVFKSAQNIMKNNENYQIVINTVVGQIKQLTMVNYDQ